MPDALTQLRNTQLEARLLASSQEFDQVYTQIKSLEQRIKKAPDTVTQITVDALFNVIQSDRYEAKKQRYFFYKEAAEILVKITTTYAPMFAGAIINRLVEILLATKSKRQRAVSEAVGSLPLSIKGPDIRQKVMEQPLELSFFNLLKHFKGCDPYKFIWHGRTMRCKLNDGRISCIKFAKSEQDISLINREIQWLTLLRETPLFNETTFHIPEPVLIDQYSLFKLTDLPDCILKDSPLKDIYPAIAYITKDAYYDYPNHQPGPDLSRDKITGIFCRCATFLGTFLAKGIVHTALIPLFHNRVQQHRRQDGGLYLWEHGGRLDQWLDSCRYPNFSSSGLRDFEHLESLESTKSIRHFSGEHMLGFVLVLGSVFRNLNPDQVGWNPQGKPHDLRCLFDEQFFYDTFQAVAGFYYQAFTGLSDRIPDTLVKKKLIKQLINVMGIDVHMEETLRMRDQLNMTEDRFSEFLISRGYSQDRIRTMKKDESDIVLTTGPHLGGFNQAISVPELIEFLFCFSALCVADRYLHENGLKGSMN